MFFSPPSRVPCHPCPQTKSRYFFPCAAPFLDSLCFGLGLHSAPTNTIIAPTTMLATTTHHRSTPEPIECMWCSHAPQRPFCYVLSALVLGISLQPPSPRHYRHHPRHYHQQHHLCCHHHHHHHSEHLALSSGFRFALCPNWVLLVSGLSFPFVFAPCLCSPSSVPLWFALLHFSPSPLHLCLRVFLSWLMFLRGYLPVSCSFSR